MSRSALAIVSTALIGSACSVSKQVSTKSDVRSLAREQRDSVRVEQVMVAVHDTIVETTTITVTLREPQEKNEAPDTVRVAQVTERDRIRDRAQVSNKEVEVRVVRDTVYIEHRDTTSVKEIAGLARNEGTGARASPFVSALKWIFWIIIAAGGLIIVIKVSKVFKIFV